MSVYLYVLRSGATGRFYVGISTFTKKRVRQHNRGQSAATCRPPLVGLVVASATLLLAGCAALRPGSGTPQVTFRVIAEHVATTDTIYIVGNDHSLGAWDPAAVPLERQPDGTWTRTIPFRDGARLEYKVTRGSWSSEALGEGNRIRPNARLTVTGPQTVEITVPAWRDQVTPRSAVTGELRVHEGVAGEGLPARTVSVWLPPGYDERSDAHFPVLYMHDGQNVFDPARAGFGMEWRIDEEATRLIGEGRLVPMIVVGIDCSTNRFQEYGDTPTGAAYRRFVVDVVKPLVDRTYRTLPDREHTAVMGSSMGGCVSFLLAWERPDVFSGAACLSPAFFKPVTDRVRRHKGERKPIRLYLDNGGIGLELELQEGCDRMLALLPKRGFVEGRDYTWFLDPTAEHNEDAWAARVWRPLEFLFGSPR